MNDKIFGRIYLITNKVNGKLYIGQTTRTLKARFRGHVDRSKNKINSMPVDHAIKKYGQENFEIKEICVAYSQEELNILEGKYINLYNTLDKRIGYNVKTVDINGKVKHSQTTKDKISQAGKKRRGRVFSNSSSKYIGVRFKANKWEVVITINSKQVYIGRYNNEIEAAQAYDIAELNYAGDNAILNFPELKEQYLQGKVNPCQSKRNKIHSTVVGVGYHKKSQQWRYRKTGCKIKYFKTKEEAEDYAKTVA